MMLLKCFEGVLKKTVEQILEIYLKIRDGRKFFFHNKNNLCLISYPLINWLIAGILCFYFLSVPAKVPAGTKQAGWQRMVKGCWREWGQGQHFQVLPSVELSCTAAEQMPRGFPTSLSICAPLSVSFAFGSITCALAKSFRCGFCVHLSDLAVIIRGQAEHSPQNTLPIRDVRMSETKTDESIKTLARGRLKHVMCKK